MDTENKAGLEPVRPGENELPELSADVQAASVMPIHNEDKLKFRDELSVMLDGIEITEEVVAKLKTFFLMHHAEMMTAETLKNELSNRHLVFHAYQKDFPDLDIKNHVREDHPSFSQFVTVFSEFEKMHQAVLKSMTLATEHFNKSCRLLEQIEDVSNDENKPEFQKVKEGQALLLDLLNLHKGVDVVKRTF